MFQRERRETRNSSLFLETQKSKPYPSPKNIKTQNMVQREIQCRVIGRKRTQRERERDLVCHRGWRDTNLRRQSGFCHHQTTVPSTGIVSVFCTKGQHTHFLFKYCFVFRRQTKTPHHCLFYSNQNLKSSISLGLFFYLFQKKQMG